MRKNIISFVAVSALIFSACAQQKKTTVSTKATTATVKSNNNIQHMAMERTPCFGTCASYRLDIYKDGKVKYTSWHYTTYEGVYEKKFDAAAVATLFKEFEEHKVDTCSSNYESLLQDMPGINYYFTYEGKETSITNANFGPEYLKTLSVEVDKFSKVDDTWTKTADAKKQ